MRIAGELLSMGRWERVVVLMPALKTAGAAREAALLAYIAPAGGAKKGRERLGYGTAIKSRRGLEAAKEGGKWKRRLGEKRVWKGGSK